MPTTSHCTECDGAHDMSNVHIVHAEVNTAKGTMGMERFIQVCRDVVGTIDGS